MGTKIRARVSSEPAQIGKFDTLHVFGCPLTSEFSVHEVEDHVLAKMKGNPHIEVQVPRAEAPKPAAPAAVSPQPAPVAPQAPASADKA